MPQCTETTWKGARAFTLANDALRVTVLPGHGARIASLVHLPTGREVLWWPDDLDTLPPPTYAMPYADHPAVGVDECLPTIWADSFRGQALPDHGEAWSLPWGVDATDAAIETVVLLRRTPFALTRRLSLRDGAVRLDYLLTNVGDEPYPALWALHPLMRWRPGTRVVLPPSVTTVETGSVSGQSPLPAYTTGATWPAAHGLDLAAVALNADGAAASTKLYAGPLVDGWAALHDAADGFAVGFAFPPDPCTHLGLWLNRGDWGGYTHVALEPATGPTEFLSEAVARGAALTLPGGESVTWFVTIAVANGVASVGGVTPDGAFLP